MSPVPLSPRQSALWNWIAGYLARYGYSPSLKEMTAGMGFRSPKITVECLRMLERKERIRRTPNQARTVVPLPPPRTSGGEE